MFFLPYRVSGILIHLNKNYGINPANSFIISAQRRNARRGGSI